VCVCVRVNCQEQSLEEEMIALLEKRKHVKAQRCAAEGGGEGGGRQGQGPEKAREQLEAQSQDQPGTQDQFDTRSSSQREREREREREKEKGSERVQLVPGFCATSESPISGCTLTASRTAAGAAEKT
jgi:hypothetical protein